MTGMVVESIPDKVVAALKRRHFQAVVAPTKAEVIDAVLAWVPSASSVFQAASPALDGLGITTALRARGHEVTDGSTDPSEDHQRQAFFADVFIANPTAVTLQGHVMGGDTHGNNVAPMIFGPAKVIVVVGINQIAKDTATAFERIAALSADAEDARRVYNCTAMLEGALPRFTDRINVIVVGEPL